MTLVIPERVINRVLDRVAMGPNGCHISTYAVNGGGYPCVSWWDSDRRDTSARVHRVAWIAHYGEIPDGLTVHHRCFNTRCMNVNHLELMTNRDNARRQRDVRELPSDGSCGHGHGPEFWVVTHRRKNGGLRYGCIQCKRVSGQAYWRRASESYREQKRARNRAYYAENREKILQQHAERRARAKGGA